MNKFQKLIGSLKIYKNIKIKNKILIMLINLLKRIQEIKECNNITIKFKINLVNYLIKDKN